MSRSATHAGSWYIGNKSKLDKQLDQFLEAVPLSGPDYTSLPVTGARFLVGPHAGYAYAGKTLAETYKAWDIQGIKRVFILGPSHHVYFHGANLSKFSTYETPLGDVPVDVETTKRLYETGIFDYMSEQVDEEEHSFEMHMPFIYKMTHQSSEGVRPIVPILVCGTNSSYDKKLAQVLAPYFREKENAFVVSSDFCHWGRRFEYTTYVDDSSLQGLRTLTRVSKIGDKPIYKAIEYLDRRGMAVASFGSYEKWKSYLDLTDNTICGRTPLGVLLKAVENTSDGQGAGYGKLKWIGYAQSSKVTSVNDSSVSYASGFAVC
jgi:AmmeMemoRadiSam system protein B